MGNLMGFHLEIEFRILDVNNVYCEEFNFSQNECLGKTDLEMGWDSNSANLFRKHDLSVWASGETETFTEMVNGKNRFFKYSKQLSALST